MIGQIARVSPMPPVAGFWVRPADSFWLATGIQFSGVSHENKKKTQCACHYGGTIQIRIVIDYLLE